MTITYTGQLAATAGTSEETLDLDTGTTLGVLVDQLIAAHGEAFATLLRDDESGRLRSTLLVVLDGTQSTGDRESLSLDGIKEIMFMTPIAGG